MFCSVWIHTSPITPSAVSRPVAGSTTRSLTPRIGRPAERGRHQADADAGDVEGRQHVEEDVGGAAIADLVRGAAEEAGGEVAVGELDALGQAGGAGGVELQGCVVQGGVEAGVASREGC